MKIHLRVSVSFFLLILFHSLIFAGFEKEFQTQLILAEPGDTLRIPEGKQQLLGTLSLDGKENIVISGKGIDESILSFKNQEDGAEGLRIINCKNIRLENFTIQDTKGDGIKVQDTDGIAMVNVKAEWTNGPNPENGAYGLYPVQCRNVVIDNCVSVGASDAGIYVGQSANIVVKNSEAYHNVAGIEIENSSNADVFGNNAHHNTGGILIFDLPDLIVKKGQNVRIFDNLVEENNLNNFAPPGNIVGTVPAGTGILVLATSDVEIYNNRIINNKSTGTGIVSYFMTELPITDSLYNPYTSAIHIHDNYFERIKQMPTLKHEIGTLLFLKFGRDVPDIIYDGMYDPQFINSNGEIFPDRNLCIQNNANADFLNLEIDKNFEKWYTPFFTRFAQDLSLFNCELPPLKEALISQ
ncbi:MAG: right-handed parallel beta-helix repeat-containing protein [Candidatus Marinimicrobia bacterium]|nr:right-handed parallel beta-helix repeat-containing protein [Candidatus Neomarinimicrobiota bacterium]